jgi:hypothetical protein
MTTTDKLLERLVKRVNESGKLLDITLTANGSMITGRLAPRAAWLSTIIEELNETDSKAFADDFAAEGGALDTEEYLHLSQGQVLFGTVPAPTKGGLLRVPLSAVDSWMVGRVTTKP